jgi:hypothetical protein
MISSPLDYFSSYKQNEGREQQMEIQKSSGAGFGMDYLPIEKLACSLNYKRRVVGINTSKFPTSYERNMMDWMRV